MPPPKIKNPKEGMEVMTVRTICHLDDIMAFNKRKINGRRKWILQEEKSKKKMKKALQNMKEEELETEKDASSLTWETE